jgi:uncharacterized protein with FMN-binding domain
LRRAILAMVGTAAGTTLLIGLKAGLVVGHPVTAGAAAPLDPAAGDGTGAGTSGTPGGAGPPGTSGAPGAPTAPGGPGAGPPATGRPGQPTGPAAGGASRPAGAPAPGTGLHAGTFTGPVVQTRYGPVQVSITVANGRMTDVTAVQTPSSHQESLRINARATPILRQEALTAQSATISTVSGATYTSGGYRTSLQGALDAARRG